MVASTGRIPTELREAWLEATGGVVADDRAARPALGHTEAAQAYHLLHTGMAQAVSDGLIPANPLAIKGASQRDARHRTERRARINTLLIDIQRNGNEGIGKPEALKHDFAGYWSRRITDEHRLVYKIHGNEIRIAACRYHYG